MWCTTTLSSPPLFTSLPSFLTSSGGGTAEHLVRRPAGVLPGSGGHHPFICPRHASPRMCGRRAPRARAALAALACPAELSYAHAHVMERRLSRRGSRARAQIDWCAIRRPKSASLTAVSRLGARGRDLGGCLRRDRGVCIASRCALIEERPAPRGARSARRARTRERVRRVQAVGDCDPAAAAGAPVLAMLLVEARRVRAVRAPLPVGLGARDVAAGRRAARGA